ncbi:MAG TPA: sulfatase [Nocardioides sp.]|jgi:arylsulfatase A-like enzyme|nr:sulfatase [Nocardioides sp.]
MSRNWSVLVLVIALSLVAAQVAADTASVSDPRDGSGRHEILRLVVDNTGPRVGVEVRHVGYRWTGDVRIAFDTRGGRRAEYVATTRHGPLARRSFRTGEGRPWVCASRKYGSPAESRVTAFSAPRSCLGRAGDISVEVTATSPGHRADTVASGSVPVQTRPNVLMIMVDDARADDLSYMPRTKALIGDRGVRFANSLAPYPLCCPARASVLRGQYAHNHRVWSHEPPWGFTSFDDRSTIATWLDDSGYSTVYLGKYLNGYGFQPRPGRAQGDSLRYVPPGWDTWRASIDGGLPPDHPKSGATYRYLDTTLSRNGQGFDNYAHRYQTRVYGRLASDVVKRRSASDRPFFFYLSFTAPHSGVPREADDPPLVTDDDGRRHDLVTPAVPDDVRGRFDAVIREAPGATWLDPDRGADKPAFLRKIPRPNRAELKAMREVTRQRAEAVRVVDAQVQRILGALRDTGELNDTLVIFTSDNGYFLGEQGIRQGKTLPYGPALQTPTLMRGPGIPAGQVRYDPLLSIDFAPTIADFADVTPRLVQDGQSMLAVARDGDRGWTRPVLTETGPREVVRNTDESGAALQTPADADIRYVVGIRTDRYLYTNIATGEEELYDMAVDPQQYTNLVHPDGSAVEGYGRILELMRDQFQRVRACDGAECRIPLPPELATAAGESVHDPTHTPPPALP